MTRPAIPIDVQGEEDWIDSVLCQIDTLRADNSAKKRQIEELAAKMKQLQRELKVVRETQ